MRETDDETIMVLVAKLLGADPLNVPQMAIMRACMAMANRPYEPSPKVYAQAVAYLITRDRDLWASFEPVLAPLAAVDNDYAATYALCLKAAE